MKTKQQKTKVIKKPKSLIKNDSIANDILQSLQSKIDKIHKKIIQLEMQQRRLKQNQRAARTRTLIQLGGLVVKSGIVEKLGIEIGTDLQREDDQKKKAYALLGLLVEHLPLAVELEKFEQLGKQFLFDTQETENDQLLNEISDSLVTD